MNLLIDLGMARTLTSLSQMILQEYFFYDQDGVDLFTRSFAKLVNGEHTNLYLQADEDFKMLLQENENAKQKFSANFLGFHLLKTLDTVFYFSENELMHFENILCKYLNELESS